MSRHAPDDDESVAVHLFDVMCHEPLKRLCELLEKDINVNSVFKVRTVRHGSVYFMIRDSTPKEANIVGIHFQAFRRFKHTQEPCNHERTWRERPVRHHFFLLCARMQRTVRW